MLLPGEKQAIEKAIELAEIYGYGNLIRHLQNAWVKRQLRDNPTFSTRTAETGAWIICPWCHVDSRTGKVVGAAAEAPSSIYCSYHGEAETVIPEGCSKHYCSKCVSSLSPDQLKQLVEDEKVSMEVLKKGE